MLKFHWWSCEKSSLVGSWEIFGLFEKNDLKPVDRNYHGKVCISSRIHGRTTTMLALRRWWFWMGNYIKWINDVKVRKRKEIISDLGGWKEELRWKKMMLEYERSRRFLNSCTPPHSIFQSISSSMIFKLSIKKVLGDWSAKCAKLYDQSWCTSSPALPHPSLSPSLSPIACWMIVSPSGWASH